MDFSSMPVAPGGEGISGHTGAFQRDRLGTLRLLTASAARIERLRAAVPVVRVCVANDPEVVAEVLVDKAKSFAKSDMLRFSLWNLAGEGLFTSNGDLWKRQRKLMAPLFTPKALSAYADAMVECAERTCATWRDGDTITLAHETTRLTMGVAGRTLFDVDTFDESDALSEALTVALDWTGTVIGRPSAILHVLAKRAMEEAGERVPPALRPLTSAAAKAFQGPVALVSKDDRAFGRAIRTLDDYVQRMIDDRRSARERPKDLLTRLLETRDEETGESMSDRQIRDEVLTLFVAGHETTATGLAWTLYLAAKEPEILAAMQREADAVGDRPTMDDLPRLDMCLRAFKEALRLYPPVYMFGRDSIEEVTVGGYELPKRTNVLVSPWAIHHSPHVWPDPERFDPDRFLPANEAARSRHAYLPFGAGPRVCLGNHFAYMEAQLALAVLLRRFDFERLADDEPEPSATLRPKHGVRMRVRARR